MDVVCLAIFTIIALSNGVASSNLPAPAPAPVCSDMVLQLVDCFSYVSADNTTAKPSDLCCDGMRSILRTAGGGDCLCETFKSSKDSGLELNMDNAVALPTACNISVLPVKKCDFGPSPAPASAPVHVVVPAHSPLPTSPSPSGALNPPSNPPSAGIGTGEIAPASGIGTGTNEIAPASGPNSSTSSSSLVIASFESLVLRVLAVVFFTSFY